MHTQTVRVDAPPSVPLAHRLAGGVVSLGMIAVLAVAATLTPSPAGLGTHTQLDLPVCGLQERTGYPCPTCGMTTAFAWTVHGQPYRAMLVQPAGALLAAMFLLGAPLAAWYAVSGRLPWLLGRVSLQKLVMYYLVFATATWLADCLRVALARS